MRNAVRVVPVRGHTSGGVEPHLDLVVNQTERLVLDGEIVGERRAGRKVSGTSITRTMRCQGSRSGSRRLALTAPPITIVANISTADHTSRTLQRRRACWARLEVDMLTSLQLPLPVSSKNSD
jgi:hypothetical protein